MGKRKNASYDIHYYTERIKKKLNMINSVRTAILEAPSGYGKTTAVRDHLEKALPNGTLVYWLDAADEIPEAGFLQLTGEIMKIDPVAGQRLFNVKFPDSFTIGEACSALRSISCSTDTYLVIEGARNLFDALPPQFFTALMEHGGKSLHIIILMHRISRNLLAAISGRRFLHINTDDFRFTAEDIQRYYSHAGVQVTMESALSIFENTGGWPAAVHMQLAEYRENGCFGDPGNILYLMEKLVWTNLPYEEQEFFMHLVPLEEFTVRQICRLFGYDAIPGYITDALENPFVEFIPAGQKYVLNRTFRKLLLEKCRERSEAFVTEIILRAGNLYLSEGKVYEAIYLYRRIKDYDRILSLNLSPLISEKAGDESFVHFLQELARCPYETKKNYPLSMLNVAWGLKTAGLDEDFDLLMNELHPIIYTQSKDQVLAGEWLLLSSFRYHPALDRMTAVLKETKELFAGRCSRVILPQSQMWHSMYNPISEFITKAGEADLIAEKYEEYIAIYTQLTGGHGHGADVLFRSVLAYQRGDIGNAKSYAYKAMYLAQSSRQNIIMLGAIHQLGQIALHEADTSSWQNAVTSLKHTDETFRCSPISRIVFDILCGLLFNELHHLESIADWLKKSDFSGFRLPQALIPPAVFVHASYLFQKGEFSQLIGFTEAWHETNSEGKLFYSMLISLMTAAAYVQLNNYSRARDLIRLVAGKTLPDGLVFPFASSSWITKGLTDELIEKEYPEHLPGFIRIKERFAKGWLKLYRDLKPEQLPESLTAREREVALLASQGLRNSEIAKKLNISENTIRAHLRTAFQKLDVDRRARLAEKLK